jgi:hypothetical protein
MGSCSICQEQVKNCAKCKTALSPGFENRLPAGAQGAEAFIRLLEGIREGHYPLEPIAPHIYDEAKANQSQYDPSMRQLNCRQVYDGLLVTHA